MITQELIQFIREQLIAGNSRESITSLLQKEGWVAADINEGFAQVAPGVSLGGVQPVVLQPTVIVQTTGAATSPMIATAGTMPATSQPVVLNSSEHSFKNPTFLIGILSVIAAAIISGVAVPFLLKAKEASLAMMGGTAFIAGTVGTLIASIIGAIILTIVTKIIKASNASFGKSLVFAGMQMIVSIALSFLVSLHVSPVVTAIIGIVAWFILFMSYYEAGIFKALGAFILNIIFAILFGAVIGVIFMLLGFGVLGFLMRGLSSFQSNISSMSIPSIPMNQVQMNNASPAPLSNPLDSTATPSAITAVSTNQFPMIKNDFPKGFPFPQASQISTAEQASDPATGLSNETVVFSANATSLSALAKSYTDLLKKDGYSIILNTELKNSTTPMWSISAMKKGSSLSLGLVQSDSGIQVRGMLTNSGV